MLEVAGLRSIQGMSRHIRCMANWKTYGMILKSRSVDFNRLLHPKYLSTSHRCYRPYLLSMTFVIFQQQAKVGNNFNHLSHKDLV